MHPIAVALLGLNALILAAAGWDVLDGRAVARRASPSPTSRSASPPTRVTPHLARARADRRSSIGIVLADIALRLDRQRAAAGARLGRLRAPVRRPARRPLGHAGRA